MTVLPARAVLFDASQQCWLQFCAPTESFTATHYSEIAPLLARVQKAVQQSGRYAVGCLSYEAAPAFDASFTAAAPGDFPLAWFGLYDPPKTVVLPAPAPTAPLIWQPSISPQQYQAAIARIKAYIASGDTYQVNFSYRLQAQFKRDPWTYFHQLIAAQACQYGAFIDLPDWAICSASPELFFRWQGDEVTCCPMKGTRPRGLTAAGDRQQAEQLQTSPKERAENVMIVDMIRNDLSRIARIGSVQTEQLFRAEQYPTVWQLTSRVTARTRATLPEILAALFPSASITGAPKARTMQIVAELETLPRRIYTGTIGFLAPDRRAQFNVAIRTVLIDKRNQKAEYGVGGGIVWDSQTESEFAECATKAQVLTQRWPDFDLLETLLWQPESGYFLLDLHVQRLQASATYFGFALDVDAVGDRLRALARTVPTQPHKVRLQVNRQGALRDTAEVWHPKTAAAPWRLGLARSPVNPSNVFLYHKTTHRHVYEQARQAQPDFDDILLWNERGELTETCIANIVLELDGERYTPPVECGLLAGTYRNWLIQRGQLRERVLTLADLDRCSGLWAINSVRQMQVAAIATPLPASREFTTDRYLRSEPDSDLPTLPPTVA